jgi:hypothetical protein
MTLIELHEKVEALLKVYADDVEVGIPDIWGFHKCIIYSDTFKGNVVVCIDKKSNN